MIIDLTDFDTPDCKICTDPTKRVSSRTFDVEGPGRVGVIYTCENKTCRTIRQAKNLFLLRSVDPDDRQEGRGES